MTYKHILLITFLNENEVTFLHTVEWFHVFLYNIKSLISVIFLPSFKLIYMISLSYLPDLSARAGYETR